MGNFKVGDRVQGKDNKTITGKIGTIFKITRENWISVEFDDKIPGGHSCAGSEGITGKYGHCWNCNDYDLKLIESGEPKYEIY